jgi:hypothetical protein
MAPRGGDPPEGGTGVGVVQQSGGTGVGVVQQSESLRLSSNGSRWLVFLSFSRLLVVLEREFFFARVVQFTRFTLVQF